HISRNLVLYSVNHDFKGHSLPYDNQLIKKKVTIGKNVWIGMNVCIVPGTVISDGVIVGMGSVVSGYVPPLKIIGNPKWIDLGIRDESHYSYLNQFKKFGGINGNLYVQDSEMCEVIPTKRGVLIKERLNDKEYLRKRFDPFIDNSTCLKNEKQAILVFEKYSWFPESFISDDSVLVEYFNESSRLDKCYNILSQHELESLKSQIILAMLDIYKCGYSHRDLHLKNMFWINGKLKIIDFETLIKRTNSVSFFNSYDITGKTEESPFNTKNNCLFSDHKYSINKIFNFSNVDELIDYTNEVLHHELRRVSNSFFTRKHQHDTRHILKRRLIYNSFDLNYTKVIEKDAQRNIKRRIENFDIKNELIRGKKVLDLGSNIGGILMELHKFSYDFGLGVEYDKEKVELSNTISALNGLNNLFFKTLDLESDLFFSEISEPFDVVFCLAILGHLKDKESFIEKLYWVTKSILFFEGNSNTDITLIENMFLKVGFSKVVYLGLSNDENNIENNNRPLFIVYK
ncbi:MAG: methyltransferase domain-containing protein, partial [Flavobacterium sp.]